MPDATQRMKSDAEPPIPLNPDEEALVRSLSRVIYSLPRALDADMTHEQRLPLIEYQALMNLSEAPDRRLRMSDLAAACDMSLSGMTGVARRLEDQGFIRRVKSEQDGRGWNAVLTDAGLSRLEGAWPTHLASVRRRFLDHLEGLDLKTLGAVFRTVAT
ncbi:MarR family transcriptional regulator [Streptomyces sp. NPDC026673]|uniref:MarR family winged helix-turn-helix transcriptional regulator n=1 Tax=Streptomyces sp. NPDC026673 TaxID=3155724 RepID=UPI0033EC3262